MTFSTSPDVQVQDGVTVIHLGPEYESLDDHVTSELRTVLLDAVDDSESPLVVMDLPNTTFFGSSFIEILLQMWKRLGSRKGAFALSGLTPNCAEVIEIAHLDTLWQLFSDRDQAVRALANG